MCAHRRPAEIDCRVDEGRELDPILGEACIQVMRGLEAVREVRREGARGEPLRRAAGELAERHVRVVDAIAAAERITVAGAVGEAGARSPRVLPHVLELPCPGAAWAV